MATFDLTYTLINAGKSLSLTTSPPQHAKGYMFFNTDDGKVYYSDGEKWNVYTSVSPKVICSRPVDAPSEQ